MVDKKSKVWLISIGLILLIIATILTFTKRQDKDVYMGKLKLAHEGYMDGIEFGIGDSGMDLAKKWGEPTQSDYYTGGLFMKYGDRIFFTDGYIDQNNNYLYGSINSIITNEAFGIHAGMTIGEVIDILGQPNGLDIYDELREDPESRFANNMFAYYYAGDYTLAICYDKDSKLVEYIELSTHWKNPDILEGSFLVLTDIEKEAFNRFTEDYNDRELTFLSPISIMKLYLHAQKEKNYEAEWELYTKDHNEFGWSKEDHMKIPKEDRPKDFSHFENPVNIEIKYLNDYKEAIVSWEDKYLEEYDASGNPFRFSFKLVMDNNWSWKVSFMPMQ